MTKKIIKIFFIFAAIIIADFVFASKTWAAGAFAANLPQCSPQTAKQRGGANCLKELNEKSCMNTTPFSPAGGVSSEMCVRGQNWCDRNRDQWGKNRCDSSGKVRNPASSHKGYDYKASCGTTITAPCDGKLTRAQKNGLQFECEICGQTYEYTFYHNQAFKPAGKYSKGQKIGEAGDLYGYPCHMHIEIRRGGVLMDPMASDFDSVVCSCYDSSHQVDRSTCFGGSNSSDMGSGGGGGGGGGSGGGGGGSGDNTYTHDILNEGGISGDPDCVYDSVVARYNEWGCMFCTPFKIIFNVLSTTAQKAYDIFAEYVVIVVLVGFAIWLGLLIMKVISTFNKVEPRIVIKTMLTQTFKVLVIVFLLQGPLEQILNFTVNPVFDSGLKLAQFASGKSGDSSSSCDLGSDAVTQDGAISASFGNGVLCTVKSVQDQIMKIVALGRVCHCLAWENTMLGFIPNFAYLLSALIFMVAGYLIIIIYPFLLIDSLLKLAVVIALLPLAMGAYVFGMKYLQKIWETFLNAMFTFIFLSIIVSIIAKIATDYAGEILTSDVLSYRIASVLWFTSGGMKLAFVCLLGWVVLGEAKDFASKFGGGIKLDIGAKVGGNVASMVKKRVGEPVKKAAVKTTGKVGEVAHKNLAHGMRRLNAARFEAFGKEAVDSNGNPMLDDDGNKMYVDRSLTLGNLLQRARGKQTFRSYGVDSNGNVIEIKTSTTKASKKVKQKRVSRIPTRRLKKKGIVAVDANGNQMYDDNGNLMYVDKPMFIKRLWNNFRGKETYKSYGYDADGNIIKTKTTLTNNTKVVEKADVFAKVVKSEGTNGGVAITSWGTRKLLDKAGYIDTDTMNNFMQNSLLSDDEKQIALVKQLVEERMSDYVGGKLGDSYKNRTVASHTDDNGNNVITIKQVNDDGTLSTFEATINQNDRVMTRVKTEDANGNAIEYATDGIIQRKSETKNGKTLHKYAVSNAYSSAPRPVYIDGSVDSTINAQNIMFTQADMERFGEQVHWKGNKKYSFGEFL